MTQTAMTSQQMLAKLVGFDTTSARSNLELIHWVQDYLDGYGIQSTLIHDATENKANLHAVIGPADKAGIVLSGHTDVVPVEGQAWDSDPFELRTHDGLHYARGTCDNTRAKNNATAPTVAKKWRRFSHSSRSTIVMLRPPAVVRSNRAPGNGTSPARRPGRS